MMLDELRKVIPSFLARVDRRGPRRGVERLPRRDPRRHRGRWSTGSSAAEQPEPRPAVTLTDFDPDAEDKLLAAICYPHTRLPDDQVLARVRRLGADDRVALLAAYVGERTQPAPPAGPRVRAHRLPVRRASPTTARSATCSATACSRSSGSRCRTLHGYDVPDAVEEAGLRDRFDEAMARSAALYDALRRALPRAGVVRGVARVPHPLRDADERARGDAPARAAHRCRRATPRTARSCQEMHRLIAEEAGHRAIAAAMRYVDHTDLRARAARRRARRRRPTQPLRP